MSEEISTAKRGYELGKRLETMDQTRRAVLEAAQRQLVAEGFRQMTMASLAVESGVTRQTIHNLFGSKRGVIEALFDTMALEGGMERMRGVMSQQDPRAMLRAFVGVFCKFWNGNRVLFRRIHGIGAIDPDFGAILEARNARRQGIARRIVTSWGSVRDVDQAVAALTALTSFEFYDALVLHGAPATGAEEMIVELALTTIESRVVSGTGTE